MESLRAGVLTFILILFSFLTCHAQAGETNLPRRYAVVIAAKSGLRTVETDNIRFIASLGKFLNRSYGVAEDDLKVLVADSVEAPFAFSPGTKKEVLSEFARLEPMLRDGDELWLILTGYASANSKGYSLATAGGRLRGSEIKDFLNKSKGRKIVFAFTTAGGVLFESLKDVKNLGGFSATGFEGENSLPRLPVFFADQISKNPQGMLFNLFNDSVKELRKFYEAQALVVPESAQLLSGGKIIPMPVGEVSKELADAFPSAPDYKSSKESLIAGGKKMGAKDPLRPERKPADGKSLGLIALAKSNAEKYKEYNAFFLDTKTILTCNRDKSTRYRIFRQVYLINDNAAPDFARQGFPFKSIVKSARIIYPDGSFYQFNSLVTEGNNTVSFPAVGAGCLIETDFEFDKDPDSQASIICDAIPVQQQYPVMHGSCTIIKPEKMAIYAKYLGAGEHPTQKNNYPLAGELIFVYKDIPALEVLPYDPPVGSYYSRVLVSSVKEWSEVTGVFLQLSRHAREVDAKTKELAEKVVGNATADTEKVKRLYDTLCSLRYMTTPFGVSGLRPRTPYEVLTERYGDCKDKANALVVLAGAVGVKGYVSLVNRSGTTDTTFPSWQFNHAVAFFPKLTGYKNGLWCDATDGETVFGSLPPGDIGRQALVIYEEKQEFSKIFLGRGGVNTIKQEIEVGYAITDQDSHYQGKMDLTLTGLPAYRMRQALRRIGPRTKNRILQEQLRGAIPGATLVSYQLPEGENDIDQPLKIVMSFMTSFAPETYPGTAGCAFFEAFADQQSPHGVVVNDGQPLKVVQVIKFKHHFSSLNDSENVFIKNNAIASGLKGAFCCKIEESFWIREITWTLEQGIFTPQEYEEVKKVVDRIPLSLSNLSLGLTAVIKTKKGEK